MIQSFRQFNRWVVAAACLLLAGKVEETPKKCRDIIKVSQSLLTEQQMAHFGSNPKVCMTYTYIHTYTLYMQCHCMQLCSVVIAPFPLYIFMLFVVVCFSG